MITVPAIDISCIAVCNQSLQTIVHALHDAGAHDRYHAVQEQYRLQWGWGGREEKWRGEEKRRGDEKRGWGGVGWGR